MVLNILFELYFHTIRDVLKIRPSINKPRYGSSEAETESLDSESIYLLEHETGSLSLKSHNTISDLSALTHWGWDKMAPILQTTFWNA